MSEMFIKVFEVNEREKIINLANVDRITSDGVTGSIIWFGRDDVDSMRVVESYGVIQEMIEFCTGQPIPNARTIGMMRSVPAMQ